MCGRSRISLFDRLIVRSAGFAPFARDSDVVLPACAAMRQCWMRKVVPISKRGTVTLPPALRRKFGFGSGGNPLILIEVQKGEIVLQPASAVTVRDIPTEVIAGWITGDEAGMREFEVLARPSWGCCWLSLDPPRELPGLSAAAAPGKVGTCSPRATPSGKPYAISPKSARMPLLFGKP